MTLLLWRYGADDLSRMYSLTTLAFTCHHMKCLVLTLSTRSSKECEVNTSGFGSKHITCRGANSTNSTRGQCPSPPDVCACSNSQLLHSFKAIPPIPKLHRFSNGVCRLKYISAREHGIILRASCHRGWGLPSGFLNCGISTSPRLDLGFAQRLETRTHSLFQPSDISPASSFPGFTPTPPQPYLF